MACYNNIFRYYIKLQYFLLTIEYDLIISLNTNEARVSADSCEPRQNSYCTRVHFSATQINHLPRRGLVIVGLISHGVGLFMCEVEHVASVGTRAG